MDTIPVMNSKILKIPKVNPLPILTKPLFVAITYKIR